MKEIWPGRGRGGEECPKIRFFFGGGGENERKDMNLLLYKQTRFSYHIFKLSKFSSSHNEAL